jgi:hypothetical protein
MKIASYDMNGGSSGLSPFYLHAIEQGKRIRDVHKLPPSWNPDMLIINPISSVRREHWKGIREYLEANEQQKVLLYAPNENEREISQLLGNHPNMEIISSEDPVLTGKRWERLCQITGLTK